MERPEINIDEEVRKLEQQIGIVMVDNAKAEVNSSRKRIDIMFDEIERALVNTRMIPRDRIRHTVERMKDEFSRNLVAKEITSTREHEYVTTKANLSTVGSGNEDVKKELESFEQTGVVSIDERYNKSIDKTCQALIDSFREPLMKMNNRQADMAFDDIRVEIKKGGASLQSLHSQHTQRIKQEVVQKLKQLGITIDSKLEQTVEEHASKNASAFLETLQKDTNTAEDIAISDAKTLSENEKAFIGSEQPIKTVKSKYEDMFK